jgi:anti-sigma regulatory factor (Ser/Thr protein kinase)
MSLPGQRTFAKQIDSLERIFAFIDGFCSTHRVDEKSRYALTLAIEELFTNMVKYSKESSKDILLALTMQDDIVRAEITDFGVQPFDLTKTKEVNVDVSVNQRKPGGLGIFLTKRIADELSYEHKDGNNIITFIKKLER